MGMGNAGGLSGILGELVNHVAQATGRQARRKCWNNTALPKPMSTRTTPVMKMFWSI